MSDLTHTRSVPPAARGGVEVRLPWWAVALPAIAFVVLLLLIAGPGEAHAATGDPAVAELLERIQQTLSD
ncbi:hypothetical protein NLX86_25090 [Streptomyces sp. A3M-1-3]|uniref:hypothetical protein n=1 Tax=Streptomyces sp. A3M-1-3 TaxID=2962044 RepID=UPI0020B7935C|nr:hypothetical protein [Streptomyces sp. A3M-1-3]MCP3821248.1 hypothetical protein [Streptomyces sp. A3M-1-3]